MRPEPVLQLPQLSSWQQSVQNVTCGDRYQGLEFTSFRMKMRRRVVVHVDHDPDPIHKRDGSHGLTANLGSHQVAASAPNGLHCAPHKSSTSRCGSSIASFTRTRKVTASLPSTRR